MNVSGDNQINSLSELRVNHGLHRRVRLGIHGKANRIGVDPMNISTDKP